MKVGGSSWQRREERKRLGWKLRRYGGIVSLNIYSGIEKDMKRMHNLFNSRDMAFIGVYKLK